MQKLLIISPTEKSIKDFTQILSSNRALSLITVTDLASAKMKLAKEDIDIVLINAPLADGDGVDLAKKTAAVGKSQVIMIMSPTMLEKGKSLEELGVFLIERPISANMFWTTIRLATATQVKLKSLSADNEKLKASIENIRIVDRAKCCLIQYLEMSEEDAHHYIEKKAMDKRVTKREIAEDILKTYEY